MSTIRRIYSIALSEKTDADVIELLEEADNMTDLIRQALRSYQQYKNLAKKKEDRL